MVAGSGRQSRELDDLGSYSIAFERWDERTNQPRVAHSAKHWRVADVPRHENRRPHAGTRAPYFEPKRMVSLNKSRFGPTVVGKTYGVRTAGG